MDISNHATERLLELLGYAEAELAEKNVTILFENKSDYIGIRSPGSINSSKAELMKDINNATQIHTAKGKTIPIMNTCTDFTAGNEEGLIVVSHDITSKIEYEKQLDDTKRKNRIAIK
ncbi:MAG: PAS domain S-box protein [Bacteroidales bacterium]|nr:PAS domain S-box protein [Bacteroidales bacterium]